MKICYIILDCQERLRWRNQPDVFNIFNCKIQTRSTFTVSGVCQGTDPYGQPAVNLFTAWMLTDGAGKSTTRLAEP